MPRTSHQLNNQQLCSEEICHPIALEYILWCWANVEIKHPSRDIPEDEILLVRTSIEELGVLVVDPLSEVHKPTKSKRGAVLEALATILVWLVRYYYKKYRDDLPVWKLDVVIDMSSGP
jgi:hypothetical protein